MPRQHGLAVGVAAMLVGSGSAMAAPGAAPVLRTFDLTYTLKLDRSDPVQLRRIWDHTHFVSSLQGIVNRREPRLYVYLVGDETGRFDRFWLGKMREPKGWLAGHTVSVVKDLSELVATFRRSITGLAVYDEQVPATSNVASTAAGAENAACVRYDARPGSLYHWLALDPAGPRIPVKVWLVNRDGTSLFTGKGLIPGTTAPSSGSAKCDAYLWAKKRYLDTGRCDPRKLAYYLDAWWLRDPQGYVPNHTLSNHDYFISKRGFFFDLSPWEDETPVDDRDQPMGADEKTLCSILRAAYDRTKGAEMIHVGGFVPWAWKYTNYGNAGGTREGVPAEWRYAEILSCFNAFMDADAIGLCGMANASVYGKYPLAKRYPQSKPTLADLRRRGLIQPDGRVAAKSYIAIYGGDYDSAAWLYWRLPDIWGDPARGTIPVGWAFNPNLADRFALGMDYARKTAKAGDTFVAGDNGAGYLNPGYLVPPRRWSGLPSGLPAWDAHNRKYYAQWGLSLTGFVIDGNAPAMTTEVLDSYARFSPDGIIGQKVPRIGMHGGMPILRMEWDLYDGEKGAGLMLSRCRRGKPEFFMYRTILWSPSDLKRMMDTCKSLPGGDVVEFVDPHTLMLLVKHFQTGPDGGKVRTAPARALRPGERTNVWDLSAGAEVTGHSPLVEGCIAGDLFGDSSGSLEDHATVLFADGQSEGFVHWVEWRTARAVRVDEIRIDARGDGPNMNREFGECRILARSEPTEAWRLAARIEPEHPYRMTDRDAGRLRDVRLEIPVTARYFRAEFTQRSAAGAVAMGPRVSELAGLGQAP